MTIYNILAAAGGIKDWHDLLDPFGPVFFFDPTIITIQNDDGSLTHMFSDPGDVFTFDGMGIPTGGTVASISHTNVAANITYATMTNVGIGIIPLRAAQTFNGLTDAIQLADPTWGPVIDGELGIPVAPTTSLIIYQNSDTTFTYLRGTFTIDAGTGEATGGTVTSVERWPNSTETGAASALVPSLSANVVDLMKFIDAPGFPVFDLVFAGNDTVTSADPDNTVLAGGTGDDNITAGAGNDLLFGRDGSDTMASGTGKDSFYYDTDSVTGTGATPFNDIITDFTQGDDKIILDGISGISSFADLSITYASGNAIVTFDANNTITLNGVAIGSLKAHDFIFPNVLDPATGIPSGYFNVDLEIFPASVGGTWESVVDIAAIPTNTPTKITLVNLDGTLTILNGTNFTFDAFGIPTDGTIWSISRYDAGETNLFALATVNGLGIDLRTFFSVPSIAVLFEFILSGNDIVISNDPDVGTTVSGGAGDDEIFGSTTLSTAVVGETLFGGSGNDTFTSNGGGTQMVGLAGADQFIGSLSFLHFDVARYDFDASLGGIGGIIAHFDTATQTVQDGFGNIDTLIFVDEVRGTLVADQFFGGTDFNRFSGLGGIDSYDGSAGSLDEIDFKRDASKGGTNGVEVNLGTLSYNLPLIVINAQTAVDGFGNIETLIDIERVRGTDQDDILFGSADANRIRGEGGADFIVGLAGADTLEGGSFAPLSNNYDTISYHLDILNGATANSTVNVVFTSGGAGTVVDSFGDTDTFTGIEVARGTQNGDTFTGGTDFNRFQGLGGSDTFDGLIGSLDETDYRKDGLFGGTAGVLVNLGTTVFDNGVVTIGAQTAIDGFSDTDTLLDIERVRGTALDDVLIGSADDNRIRGEAGNDLIQGGAGIDTLDGGAGLGDTVLYTDATAFDVNLATGVTSLAGETAINFENINIGDGDNVITGSTAANIINTNGGNDTIDAGLGSDTVDAGAGDDRIILTASVGFDIDTLDGGTGRDVIDFSAFAQAVWVNLGFAGDEAWTRDFSDILANLNNIENIIGTAFDDKLIGDGSDNSFGYTGGFDNLIGGLGSDTGDFSAYTQGIWASLGFAGFEVWNRDFSATLADLDSIENIVGTAFDDRLIGDGNDNVLGYTGGFDNLIGGLGSDTGDFSAHTQGIWASLGFAGFEVWNRDFSGILADLDSIDNIVGTAFNDRLIGDGNDNVLGYTGGFDDLRGGLGSDTGDFSAHTQGIWASLGFAGFEVWNRDFSGILADLDSIENLVGTAFDDRLIGDANDNVLGYTGGFDTLLGGAGFDTADFSAYDQGVWVSLAYAGFEAWNRDFSAVLADLNSIENITGSAFDDRLIGDAAVNLITGGLGVDTLTGGDGSDLFIYNAGAFGNDFITDFQDTGSGFEDLIDVSQSSANWATAIANVDYSSGSAVLTTTDGTLTLNGVTANVDVGDFIL